MRIMAVDYGDARTGVALCDAGECLASPYIVHAQNDEDKLLSLLAADARQEKVEKIVVGYPLNMDGSPGPRAQKCAAFAQKLSHFTGLDTALWDERCTTIQAHRALNVTDTRGKKRKAVIDAVSAVMILEGYLAYRKTHQEDPIYPQAVEVE